MVIACVVFAIKIGRLGNLNRTRKCQDPRPNIVEGYEEIQCVKIICLQNNCYLNPKFFWNMHGMCANVIENI